MAAFILYRQRHQAEILAQHPGLPNPEISKIAGERWKSEPESVKNEWKLLAEVHSRLPFIAALTHTDDVIQEEKARHAQLYPGYRFRPKHKSHRGSTSSVSTTIARPYRCSKCGGRSIVSGVSPFTSPLDSNTLAPSSGASPGLRPAGREGTESSQYMPQVANLSLSSPQAGGFGANYPEMASRMQDGMDDSKRRRFSPYPASLSPRGGSTIMANEANRPSTGGLDRRRAHSNSISDLNAPRRQSVPYSQEQHPYSSVQPNRTPTTANSPLTGTPAPNGVSARLAPIMGPPPPPRGGPSNARPGIPAPPASARLPPTPRRPTLTTDLRLPPLQTGPPSAPADLPAQVMSLNTVAKIKLLRTVAAPLAVPGGTQGSASVRQRHRGAVVAVEGEDAGSVDAVCTALLGLWARDFDVCVVRGPRGPVSAVGFADYMAVVSEWHAKRAEMVQFLMGEVVGEGEEMDVESDGEKRVEKERVSRRDSVFRGGEALSSGNRGRDGDGDADVDDSEVSPKGTAASPMAAPPSPVDDDRQAARGKIPLLVIPHYTLHTSNVWASALPISDAYSPADHWQWVATLWRGIVGPDFTVYVRSSEEPPETTTPPGFSRPGVEIREDLGTFIMKGGGKVDDGSVRRVAFELGEWARPGGMS